MTVEVLTRGQQCNIGCKYCYQQPVRDAGNAGGAFYDLDAIKATILKTGQGFTMFGGEALLTPIEDLEEMFRWGLEQYQERLKKGITQHSGPNGVQTNGTLVTEAHLDIFKKYQVHVGFSMDGPLDLNDSRWAGTIEKTRELTATSQWAIEQCLARGISCSLIVTLHRDNAGTPDKIERVKQWLRDLDVKGLRSARLHNLEVDGPEVAKHMLLTQEESITLFLEMARFESELKNCRFDVFVDMEKALVGDENVTCTWAPCDPYTTSAVHGVDEVGNLSNCGRVNKDGVMWQKADTASRERQLALYNTPQEHGGCQGCRFFLQCKGQCPGTAINSDWRNKSRDCGMWMGLLTFKEAQLLAKGKLPLSLAPDRVKKEQKYLAQLWSRNGKYGGTGHGDHTDHGGENVEHGDSHGDHTDAAIPDIEHGDVQHGDHTDAEIARPTIQLPIKKVER